MTWGGVPDAVYPEEGQARQQASPAQIQACHRLLDAVPVSHNVQAAVICHIALHHTMAVI